MMQDLLHDIIVGNLFAFLLIFMRFGMALFIMPGIGDSFVTPQVRLLFALAMSLILTPVLSAHLPPIPAQSFAFVMLLLSEAFIGVFIGTVMRIMVSAFDTAGMVVSTQAGFATAMLFNPVTGTQGSIVGSLYSMLGVTLLLVMNLHHYMLASVVDSYQVFPAVGALPDVGAMSEVVSKTVTIAFRIGIQMAMPFLIVGTIMQIGFGLLSRLIPQIQIFFLALPAQIWVGLLMLVMVLSATMLYWVSNFEDVVTQALSPQ